MFVGSPGVSAQLACIIAAACIEPTSIRIDGDCLRGEVMALGEQDGNEIVAVPVRVDHPMVGQRQAIGCTPATTMCPSSLSWLNLGGLCS
ncbi:hypothetical protein [Mycobacterium uberis]|uniref:hypothetical protein n=1 Tax=Mycobacterium uberis TaxID=2162698 RepID=UPI000E3098D8